MTRAGDEEPIPIGVAAEHRRLRELAASVRGSYTVYRGSFDDSMDPEMRDRPSMWFVVEVTDETPTVMYASVSAADIDAFLMAMIKEDH